MRILLDTHAAIWWFRDDQHLSPTAKTAIQHDDAEVFVSAATAWEVATKARVRSDTALTEVADRFEELVTRNGFERLPVNHLHGLRAGSYAVLHRDPFDRMLAAQSELENLTLVTRDPAFGQFGVDTFW